MTTRLITVVTPCYNEEGNVRELYLAVRGVFEGLPQYRYEHLFIDNASQDATAEILRALAAADPKVKVIVNSRNFGPVRSPVHGILQAEGDAVIGIACDFQEPPALIPDFLRAWEAGSPIVLGVKLEADEGRIMYMIRDAYYRLLARIADVEIVHQATGFGLYDQAIIRDMRRIDDPYPFLRGLIAEIGYRPVTVPFRQPVRRSGQSKISTYQLFDVAFQGFVNYSKVPLRLASLLGFAVAGVSLITAFGYLVAKLMFWSSFSLGLAPVVIGVFFVSAIQLIFIGVVGEYVGAIYTQVKHRPLVFEKERINFAPQPATTASSPTDRP
ncbi:glycosyltransferase family 2 protein [Roseisolibacter agri]|uniref:Glycosyl hydrolase n=1 Tax=Roseisolibacter agri TaxID=2014610 RepID=A0AA37Q508_9BACT|nr:glycosyltransferase family 2 protein [Roseisolibacter agri]GLC26704.1 glycosyl hydrolase [Roseisolibacter agri]